MKIIPEGLLDPYLAEVGTKGFITNVVISREGHAWSPSDQFYTLDSLGITPSFYKMPVEKKWGGWVVNTFPYYVLWGSISDSHFENTKYIKFNEVISESV